MNTQRETDSLSEIKEALRGPNVSIRLVETFTHGRGAQLYVKTRKVGPLVLPAKGEDLSHVLAALGHLAMEMDPS